MISSVVTRKLGRAFPGSFINVSLEFIAHRRANEYFRLEDCESDRDVQCKVLEWFSRGAHKTCPYQTKLKNDEFHQFMLNGINTFLDTEFTIADMALIYQALGNSINRPLTERFIESGYNLNLLKEGSK